MIPFLFFLLCAAVGGVLIWLGASWWAAVLLAFIAWYVACRMVYKRRRIVATEIEALAADRVRAMTGAGNIFVDPPRNFFVAVDVAGSRMTYGAIDGGGTATILLAELDAATVKVDEGWGMFLNREFTPPGRVVGLVMTVLIPVFILGFFASLFSGDHTGGFVDDTDWSRVKRILLILTRSSGETIELPFYDEHGSAIHPRARAREPIARDFLAFARRPILARAAVGGDGDVVSAG